MIKIAILGLGTVGTGVVKVVEANTVPIQHKLGQPLSVKTALVRKLRADPYQHLMTENFREIEHDGEIRVVVETIGGVEAAYEYTRRCLMAGKHVVSGKMIAVELAGLVLHGGDGRALGVGEHFEAGGRGLDGDAVAHPRVLLGRGAGEQPVRLVDGRVGLAVFAERGLVDVGAERVRHGLEAVADAEHGHAGVEQLGIDARGAGLEYGCGAA